LKNYPGICKSCIALYFNILVTPTPDAQDQLTGAEHTKWLDRKAAF